MTSTEPVQTFSKKWKIFYWGFVLIVVALAATLILTRPPITPSITPPMFPDMLRETQKIILVRYHPDENIVLLDDEKAIKEFVKKIQLVPKEHCLCAFEEYLEFHTQRGILIAYMSDHCLIIKHGEKGPSIECKMPPGLWELYQTHRSRVIDNP